DGKRLAVIRGSNENHDIYVLEPERSPPVPPKPFSTWRYDDLRPVWSPDGKRLAFYTNYNPAGDPKVWAIAVVAADGTDPTEGEGLAARAGACDGGCVNPAASRTCATKDRRTPRSTSSTSTAARARSCAPGPR